MPDFDQIQLNHAVINTLQAVFKGVLAKMEAAGKMGLPQSRQNKARLENWLAKLRQWEHGLIQEGRPLFLTRKDAGFGAAFRLMNKARQTLAHAAGYMDRLFFRTAPLEETDLKQLASFLIWNAVSRENYLGGMMRLARAMNNAAGVRTLEGVKARAEKERNAARRLVQALVSAGDGVAPERMTELAAPLPGLFRSQMVDMGVLAGTIQGRFTWADAGISDPEAQIWQDMSVGPDRAAYWRAFGIFPKEAASWMRARISNPAAAGAWKSRGVFPGAAGRFTQNNQSWQDAPFVPFHKRSRGDDGPKQAAPAPAPDPVAAAWARAGFDPKTAGAWIQAGLRNPGQALEYYNANESPARAARWLAAGVSPPMIKVFDSLEEVEAFAALGYDADAAQRFKAMGMDPHEAGKWKRADIVSIEQVALWRKNRVVWPAEARVWMDLDLGPEAAGEWKSRGFSPNSARAWMGLGFTHPDEAAPWREKGGNDPEKALEVLLKQPKFMEEYMLRLLEAARRGIQEAVAVLGDASFLPHEGFTSAFGEAGRTMLPDGGRERIHFARHFCRVPEALCRACRGRPSAAGDLALACANIIKNLMQNDPPPPAAVRIHLARAHALILRRPGKDGGGLMEKGLAILSHLDKQVDKQKSPVLWGRIHAVLGQGLLLRKAKSRDKNLILARRHLKAALAVLTPESSLPDRKWAGEINGRIGKQLSGRGLRGV